MSNVVVRRYREEDREAFGRVRSITYRGGEPIRDDEVILRDDCLGYVAELHGEIVACHTVLRMTCNIDGTQLPCAGVAAVAVLPEHRGTGVGSQLMSKSMQLLAEDGFAMSSLYPYRETFYAKSGYATCGARLKMTVPSHRLTSFRAEIPVRKLDQSEWSKIKPCYEAFARRYNGTNIRGDSQWWRTYGGDTPFAIYAAGDPVEGYALVRLAWDFWAPQEVKEIAWSSKKGYDAILSILRTLAINKSEVSWYEPFEGPYFLNHMDQGVNMAYEKHVMYRILDLPRVLASRKAEAPVNFVLTVHDSDVPANTGSWSINSHNGLTVERTDDIGLSVNIRPLTQAVLGLPSYEALANAELMPKDAEAQAFFSPRNVYNPDFF